MSWLFEGLFGWIILITVFAVIFGEPNPNSENMFPLTIGDPPAAINYEPLKTAIAEALAELSREAPGDN